jgi:hypothetical protein
MLMFGGHADAAHQLLRTAARAIRDIDRARSGAILTDAALECVPAAKVEAAVSVAREACELASAADPFARSILACALA